MHTDECEIHEVAVDGYVAEQVSTGRWTVSTGETRQAILGRFVRDMAGGELTAVSVSSWIAGRSYSAYYRRARWSAVSGYLRWAGVDLELVAPAAPTPAPRPLKDVDVGRLLGACDARAEVIVSLGICEGLRRGEMAGLQLSDIDFDGSVLFVSGKGGKQRWIPLTKATGVRIQRYLDAERGHASGPLVLSRRNGQALTGKSIGALVRRVMKKAGISGPGVNLHALRHTAATRLWMETSDLFMTQQLLGHANIRTTAMYVKARPTAEMREAMNRCST